MTRRFSRLSTDLSVARLGKPNGFAPLGPDNKVPAGNLPAGVASNGLVLQGTYNASTNAPDLTLVGNQVDGHLYIVEVAGTQDIGNGSENFTVGDTIFWSDTETKWYHLQGSVLATEVSYDNTSGLSATNAQDAIDELVIKIDPIKKPTVNAPSTLFLYINYVSGNDNTNDASNVSTPAKTVNGAWAWARKTYLFSLSSTIILNFTLSNYTGGSFNLDAFDLYYQDNADGPVDLYFLGTNPVNAIPTTVITSSFQLRNFEFVYFSSVSLTNTVTLIDCRRLDIGYKVVSSQTINLYNTDFFSSPTLANKTSFRNLNAYNCNSVRFVGAEPLAVTTTNQGTMRFYNCNEVEFNNINIDTATPTANSIPFQFYDCTQAKLRGTIQYDPNSYTATTVNPTWFFNGCNLENSANHEFTESGTTDFDRPFLVARNSYIKGDWFLEKLIAGVSNYTLVGTGFFDYTNCYIDGNITVIGNDTTLLNAQDGTDNVFISLKDSTIINGPTKSYIDTNLLIGGTAYGIDERASINGSDYDNTISGLTATTKQDAIDELTFSTFITGSNLSSSYNISTTENITDTSFNIINRSADDNSILTMNFDSVSVGKLFYIRNTGTYTDSTKGNLELEHSGNSSNIVLLPGEFGIVRVTSGLGTRLLLLGKGFYNNTVSQRPIVKTSTITSNITLNNYDNKFQNYISNTPSLEVFLPSSPLNGTHFYIINNSSSSENINVVSNTNSITLLPSQTYEVISDGTGWITL